MQDQNYTTTFVVDKTPEQVYTAINNVKEWWSEDFKGQSHKLNDEFSVTFFGDLHYSKHQVTELVPNEKIVWLVTDSKLNFLNDKTEWTGTKNIFEISPKGDKTEVRFTHEGLVPAIQCYKDCTNGWNHYLLQSLMPYITAGVGKPTMVGEVLGA